MTGGRDSQGEPSERLEARCRVLQEALSDVEADNRELRAQLAALSETCERLTGGGDRGSPLASMTVAPRQPSAAARLKRLARAVVRATVGSARRLWQAGDPGQRYVVAVRPTGTAASGLPTISVVVLTTGESGPAGRPEIVQGQTADGLELASWDAATGDLTVWSADGIEVARRGCARSREELLDTLAGEWLMMVPRPLPRLPATLLEDLQWLVATEPLLYVRVPVQPRDIRHSDGAASELFLCAREVFDPVHLIDLDRLAQAAHSHPVVGKTARLAGPLDAASPRPVAFAGHGRGAVVAVGRYELWARNRSGPVEHPVAFVPIGAAAGETDPRPAVLLVVAAPLDGGVDRMVSGLLQTLGGEIRFHVVTTSADNILVLTRAALLENAGAAVHEIGSFLDPSAWPSAVVRVADRCMAGSVLLVGWDGRLAPAAVELRGRGLRLVALAVDDGGADVPADLWLAASAADAEGLARAGISPGCVEIASLGFAEISVRRPGSYGRDQAVRSALGVPEGHRLVLTVGDLVPRCRPEDVVLVADRLRDEDGLFFLLVGEGPLAGQVADLATYLDLTNVCVRPQGHSPAELAAAADVVLDPAEAAPSRPAVVAALAAGRPVVATRGGGITELLGSSAVESTGGPEALAGALRRVLSGEVQGPDLDGVRKTIESRAAEGIEVLRRALLAGGPDGRSA